MHVTSSIFVYWNHKWHTEHVYNQSTVIRNTAHRPSTQASYTIGSGTTMQENQQAAQIAAKHNIIPQMAPYMSWIFLVLVGIDPGVSHLRGEIVSHNTTDARVDRLLRLRPTARHGRANLIGRTSIVIRFLSCSVINKWAFWLEQENWRSWKNISMIGTRKCFRNSDRSLLEKDWTSMVRLRPELIVVP